MPQITSSKQVSRAVRHLLDLLTVLYVLDLFTFYACTDLLYFLTGIALNANRWILLRWIFSTYVCFRLGQFAWYRNKIGQKWTKKQRELLDKHGRLNDKLKLGEKPAFTTDEVTKMYIPELRTRLLERQITAVDVIDAYQRKALEIFQRHPGCLAEIVFDSDVFAILADSRLDEIKASGAAKDVNPLLGVPISIQEWFPIRGFDHTMGFTSQTHKAAEDDCAVVAALKDAGAIPFALTNVRQKLVNLTSENPIFGRTRHPTHIHRACVSGDAALIVLHGSPLSIGADMLGGARLTAAFCGLVALKPTTGRMSQKGLDLPLLLPRLPGVIASPIGRTVEDVADVFRGLWTSALFKHDTSLCPLPFSETQYTRGQDQKLRIGYYHGFEKLMPVSPAVERVMQQTKRYLESKGHELVEFQLPEPERAYQLVMSLVNICIQPETLRLVYQEGHGDQLVDYKQRALHALYALPSALRKFISYLRAESVESYYPVTAVALRAIGCTDTYEQLTNEAEKYRETVFEAWNDEKLDCLLCPISPIPTPWDYSSFYTVNAVLLYAAIYNLLGCPAGTVQVGQVEREDKDQARQAIKPDDKLKNSLMFAQQLDRSEGLPLGIQVVAKPWQDELVLGVLKSLEQMKS